MKHIGASKELLSICNAAIDTFGSDFQVLKNVEEMGESSTELMKYLQAEGKIEKIQDEIADVLITTLQMMIMFGDSEIQKRINYKAVRLMTKVRNHQKDMGDMH